MLQIFNNDDLAI